VERYQGYIEKRKVINRYYFRNIVLPFLLAIGLVIRATFFIRRRDPSAFAEIDVSNMFAIVLVLMAIPFLLSKRGMRAIKQIMSTPLKYYVYYSIWCFISVFWSSDIIYSLFRITELLVTLFLIAYILIDVRSKEYAKRILLFFLIFSLIAAFGFYLKSGWFSFERFHNNEYPMLSASGILIGIFFFIDRRRFDYDNNQITYLSLILFSLSVLGIIYGTSSASNVSLILSILLLVSLRESRIITTVILMISILVVWFAWQNYQAEIMKIVFPGKTITSIETATGRTSMWKYYMDGFLEKPLLGWGFPTGEKEGFKFGWVTTSTSHNMLISVAINTGIIGLLLFSTFMISYTLYIIRKLRDKYFDFKWIAGAWFVFVINSMSLPALGSHWMWLTSSIFFIMVYSVTYYK